MSMKEWAEKEVEIACKRERDQSKGDDFSEYACSCYQSALKAFRSLCEDGHSGMSIGITKSILNRMIEGKPLTPIEDVPEIWSDTLDVREDHTIYQCVRMSSLFKTVYKDGTVTYSDNDRFFCTDINTKSSYFSGLVGCLLDEMFPIKMPYYPDVSKRVWCEEFLFDPKNGDFDTVGVLYTTINENRVEIQRFFTDPNNIHALTDNYTPHGEAWVEISRSDFERLKGGQNG